MDDTPQMNFKYFNVNAVTVDITNDNADTKPVARAIVMLFWLMFLLTSVICSFTSPSVFSCCFSVDVTAPSSPVNLFSVVFRSLVSWSLSK